MNRKNLFATLITIMIVLAVSMNSPAQRTAKTQVPSDANLMDLNSAPPEKLMTLPGIDLILAKKIIAGRPYKAKTDLTAKKIIPQEAYNAIMNKVMVKQEPPAKAPPRKGR